MAEVPEFRFVTGRFPVTSFASRTVRVLLAPEIVLLVSVPALVRNTNVSLTFAMSGRVSVEAPTVWAARETVTVWAEASAGRNLRPPEVLPLISTNPVFVLPDAKVRLGVVASLIVVAPERVLAPVEVMNVPVLPAKVLAEDPEAVRPAEMTGLVRVLAASVCVAATPTNVSVPVRRDHVPAPAAAAALMIVVPEPEPARMNFPLLKVLAPVTVWMPARSMSPEPAPVFVTVTAPVAWSTEIPVPAMMEVTPPDPPPDPL